jgi:PAS domain S-box-containing protein
MDSNMGLRRQYGKYARWEAYLISGLSVLAILAFKLAIKPIVGIHGPFLHFSLAIILSAWLGGFGPGIVATVLSTIAIDYYFFSPGSMLPSNDFGENLLYVFFLLQGVLIAVVIDRMRVSSFLRNLSQKHYAQLVESAKDFAIFSLSIKGEVTTWNSGAQNLFGFHDAEILGKNAEILFTPEDRARGVPQLEMETAKNIGRAEDNRWHIRRDGTRFFASGILTCLYDESGELNGFTKVARDITSSKQDQDQLRYQLELLGLSYDAIIVRDIKGMVQFWNRGAKEIFGWSEDEVRMKCLGKTFIKF